jgi:hypothetical protein
MKITKANVAIVAKKALLPLIYFLFSKCTNALQVYFAKITNDKYASAKFD